MTYPPFDLEKALAGEPVAYRYKDEIKKGYLYKSRIEGNRMLVEVALNSFAYHLIYSAANNILGMWQEPVKFDNWHLLNENVTAIKRDTAHKWVAIGMTGEPFASYNIHTLKPDFFPVCEIGTIIKRPD